MLKVPVLFLVFNRPTTTKIVFDSIRKQKPEYLFIAADGPRNDYDSEKCTAVRSQIMKDINWPCTVKTLFRDANLGCGKSVSSAISWFFEQVEEGIILEDDCVPNDSFFQFCEMLLEKYRYNEKISAISGNNFQRRQPMSITEDYYYSVFPSSWGWATWKRSWLNFDLHLSDWQNVKQAELGKFLFKEKKYANWWKEKFEAFYLEKLDHTWDFQFHYLSMVRNQYAILPKANLIRNIGHGPDATHFLDPNSYFANMPTYEINFPLKHPLEVIRNYEADLYHQQFLFGEIEVVGPVKRVKRLIKQIMR